MNNNLTILTILIQMGNFYQVISLVLRNLPSSVFCQPSYHKAVGTTNVHLELNYDRDFFLVVELNELA